MARKIDVLLLPETCCCCAFGFLLFYETLRGQMVQNSSDDIHEFVV